MGLLDGDLNFNLPLLQGSLGLLAAGERGDSTGLALGQGLLGFTQGRQALRAADEEKADKALQRQIHQAQLANLQARTGELLNPTVDPTGAQRDYLLARQQGFNGTFLDYQTALANAKRTQINNNVNTAPPFKIPANFMLKDQNDPSQGVVPIPGSPGGQLSGEGAKLEEISRGGADAVRQLQERMRSGDIDQGTLAAAAVVPTMFQTANVQQFETLAADLTDMIGRLRSGGAITKDEESRFKGLVPKFGDKPETIEFKLKQLSDKFNNINSNVQLAPTPEEDLPKATGTESIDDLLKIYGN